MKQVKGKSRIRQKNFPDSILQFLSHQAKIQTIRSTIADPVSLLVINLNPKSKKTLQAEQVSKDVNSFLELFKLSQG